MSITAKANSASYALATSSDIPDSRLYHWNEDIRNASFATFISKLAAHSPSGGGTCTFKICAPASVSPTKVAQWMHGIYFQQSGGSGADMGVIWADVSGAEFYVGLVSSSGISWRKAALTLV